jgi:hypothetical protein
MAAALACPSYTNGRQTITIRQGDDWSAAVHVYRADRVTDADLTGYVARAQIREAVADVADDVIVEMVCTVQSPLINLSIPRSATVNLIAPNYVWDLEVLSPSDVQTTILWGSVSVALEVTREGIAVKKAVRPWRRIS